MKNPYETLGVKKDATDKEIKAARRKLAAENHPDREGGDAERMSEVNQAVTLLLDPERRKRYDETGSTANKVPTIEEDAMQQIYQAMSELCAENFQGNIFEQTKAVMQHEKIKAENFIIDTKKWIEKFNKRAAKLKLPEDVMANLLARNVGEKEKSIQAAENTIQLLDIAMKKCDEFKDKWKPKKRPPDDGWGELFVSLGT